MSPEFKAKLIELGLTEEQVSRLETAGAKEESDLVHLTAAEFVTETGCGTITAKKIVAAFAPTPATSAPSAVPAAEFDPHKEIPEGVKPNAAQMGGFAQSLGVPAELMSMFMMSNLSASSGMEFDISSMFPISTIVAGYNPRVRNPYMMFMGQLEKLYGGPIVVINEDGAVNRELTVAYITSLENGDPLADDDVYYDKDANAYQLIAVGIDPQGVRDADPLKSDKPLPESNIGTGRVNWNGVGLDVRQVVYYAVTQTHELNPEDENHTSWLRDHVKAGVSRLIFVRQYPKAIQYFNAKSRTGDTPTLKVMPSRGPRRKEIMPRRRGILREPGLTRTSEEHGDA